MAELMDKQGILDELRRRSGGAQQEQTPMMDKQQILDYLQKSASGQQELPTYKVKMPTGPSAKDAYISNAVKKGWADYQAQQEKYKAAQEQAQEPKKKTVWDTILEGIAGIGSDTTLPGVGGSQVVSMSKEAQANDPIMPRDNWTDNERYAFGYLWNTQRQKAYDYARAVNNAYTRQQEEKAAKEAADKASSGFWSGVANTAGAIATAPLGLADTLKNLIDYGATGHIQEDGRLSPFEWSQAATGGISQKLNEKGGVIDESVPVLGGKGWGDVYSLGTSIVKSITAAYTGGAGQALITNFGPAMASATESAKERGATDEQAMSYGFLSGLAEAAAEMVGVDNLLKLGTADSLKAVMKNLLKQGTTEALEEGLTSVVDNLADNLVLQDKSVLNQRIAAYTEQGMTPEQAKKQAWLDMAGDVIFDMLGGFVSGAASGGLETIVQTVPTLGRKPSGTAQQAATPTQSEETVQSEKVPTKAETPTQAAQTAQTPSQPMTPQQALQETIAETIGVPSVTQAVESFRQNGKVSNSQAEAIIADDGVFREILEMTGIAPPATKSESRAAVKQAVATLAQQAQTTAETAAKTESTVRPDQAQRDVAQDAYNAVEENTRPVMRNEEAEAEYQQRLSEWEARQQATGGFGSVGAANVGFAKPSPVDPLIERYGSLPSGENPVRSDELPKSVTGQDRVSQTAVTVKGAQATPDDFVDTLDEDVAKGGMSYIPIKNSNTTQEAVDYITREGWTQALANWTAAVNSGKSGSDLVAQGALLLNNAASAGNKQQWLDILHTYQKLGTNTAQGLQAMRILKTLAPSDKLYMIRRSVQQMVDDMKLDTDIVLDEGLMESYKNAKTDAERDEILSQIQQSVADQIPSTFMEKFTALRYVNMLGNLRTQARNIVGNVAMKGVSSIKNAVASGIEELAYRVSGGKFKKTKSFTVSKAQLASAMADFADIKSAVMGSGRYADSRSESTEFAQGVQDKRTIFKSDNKVLNTAMKPLEGYRKVTNWAMEQGDLFFAQRAYARALAGYIKAQGISETNYAKISPAVMEDARLYAAQEAREQTFRDTNWLSGWVSKVGRRKDTPKAVKVISEGIMPFRKTPANVLVRAEEYSPLGVINSVYYSIQAARKGSDVTGAQVVNSWAKSLTGTGLFALGMLLQSLGVLTTGPDEDENKESFESLNGWQNYAIVLPDGTNVTIDFLTPSAMPLLMGAELKSLMEDGGISVSDLESALTSIGEPMVQMSMLQGVSDALDNVQYAKNNLGQFVINSALSYLTQGLTNTALGQLERGFESSRNTTYVDKESGVPDWLQKALGKASAKTPGLDYNQIPYINAWGEEEKNLPTGLNLAYNLLSPGYVESGRKDALTEELNRLGNSTGENVYPDRAPTYVTVDGERVHFSAEEYVSFAKDMGQTQKKLLEQVLAVPGYKDLPDAQKAEVVQAVYKYAKETASERAVPEYDASIAKWIKTAERRGNLPEAIIDRISENARKKELEEKKEAQKESYWATKSGQ